VTERDYLALARGSDEADVQQGIFQLLYRVIDDTYADLWSNQHGDQST
jgi:hypothetical protein